MRARPQVVRLALRSLLACAPCMLHSMLWQHMVSGRRRMHQAVDAHAAAAKPLRDAGCRSIGVGVMADAGRHSLHCSPWTVASDAVGQSVIVELSILSGQYPSHHPLISVSKDRIQKGHAPPLHSRTTHRNSHRNGYTSVLQPKLPPASGLPCNAYATARHPP